MRYDVRYIGECDYGVCDAERSDLGFMVKMFQLLVDLIVPVPLNVGFLRLELHMYIQNNNSIYPTKYLSYQKLYQQQ